MYNVLETIETQTNHIAHLKTQVLQAKLLRLQTGLEGFNSPESYGVYKHTGGDALGVVKDRFTPCNLQLFLDAIEKSVLESGIELDLTKLTYTEYYGGSKIAFRLPLKKYEIQTPMVGDTLETAIEFRTGFDGQTKMSLGFYALRLWCANGAKNWKKDVGVAMKNTEKNQAKLLTFTNEIFKVVSMTDNYVQLLNNATLKQIKQSDIDRFIKELTGYDMKEYNDLQKTQRNIIDSINGCIAIEMANTGANMFSLLQGITRYTTHDFAENSEEKLLYSKRANDLNEIAHELAFAELN